ncbi:MAG: hypothetical protein R3B53_04460 [Candidatus Paceibacterota bacterium]
MKVAKKYNSNRLITAGCLTLLLAGVVAYMYFLSLSVVHVVMRNEVLQSMGQLRSEIAYLETAYIEANHTISSKVATLQGFNTVENKIFIDITTGDKGLVLRNANE